MDGQCQSWPLNDNCPYEFIGFGAMDGPFSYVFLGLWAGPGYWYRNVGLCRDSLCKCSFLYNAYEFIGFWGMDTNSPYEFIEFGAMDGRFPYQFLGFGAMDGPFSVSGFGVRFPYAFIEFGTMDGSCPYDLFKFNLH